MPEAVVVVALEAVVVVASEAVVEVALEVVAVVDLAVAGADLEVEEVVVIEVDEAEEDSAMSTVLQFLPIREELWPMPVQQRRRSLTERL